MKEAFFEKLYVLSNMFFNENLLFLIILHFINFFHDIIWLFVVILLPWPLFEFTTSVLHSFTFKNKQYIFEISMPQSQKNNWYKIKTRKIAEIHPVAILKLKFEYICEQFFLLQKQHVKKSWILYSYVILNFFFRSLFFILLY